MRASARRRGVGSALLEGAIAWARAAAMHKIALEVFAHNDVARALYRKHGFLEEGYFRGHLRRASGALWDAIPMGLLLVAG